MLCPVITKNSNWETLIKNLVTFKKWDCVKDEKLSYFCGSQKNPSFMGGEGVHKKPLYREDCLKRGALTICRFKGGGSWPEREWWYFWGGGGVDTSVHTMLTDTYWYWKKAICLDWLISVNIG